MEQVYEVGWREESTKFGHNDVGVSAWSYSNLFVFTTQTKVDGYRKQYINVLNPNEPWNAFSCRYRGGKITCLEWDRTGTKFLSGDSQGRCCVWTLKNNMSNMWRVEESYGTDLPGEEVLTVNWLHRGVKVSFPIEKMEVVSLTEKFPRSVFKPSIVQFGGKHVDGYILVTATGLVHVQCVDSEFTSTFGRTFLNVTSHQRIADVRFTNQGKIYILTSSGVINRFIQFHEVELRLDSTRKKLSFQVNPLPGFAVKCSADENCLYTHISHAKFVEVHNQDFVVVCVSSSSGSRFEGWLLRKENVSTNRIFQQTSPSHATSEPAKMWKCVTASSELPKVLDFCPPANTMGEFTMGTKAYQEKKFYCGRTIAITLAGNSIQLLDKLSLKPLLTHQHGLTQATEARVRCATFSTLSCALITIDDRGAVRLFKVPPWLSAAQESVEVNKDITQLLLYCLLTGRDWWEVLLHTNPKSAQNVVDLLTAELKKQAAPLQQSLESRFLAMKITLHQLSNSAAATDCHLKLLFNAMSLVFRSLFRPAQQVTSEENDPSLRLQAVCRTSFETDINQLLQNVDAVPQTLQSMQQLIQWVADVTLYLLASVPYHQINKTFSRPCSTLTHDHEWLTLLRELLVVIRVWTLLKSACSPVFHVLDSKLEVLPHAFRLVTLLWQASSPDGAKKEISTQLINECCLLPSQVIIPPLEIVSAVNGVLSHLSLSSRLPKLKFGESQNDVGLLHSRQRRTELVALSGSSGKVDSLRRVFLGKKPNQELKECTRCGIVAMYNSLGPSILKMWDQRFIKNCLCGGLWRKMGAG